MIMVTNSQRVLQMADLVIHMENGRISQVKKNLSAKNTQSVSDTGCVDCSFHDRPEASETISAMFENTDGSDETSPVSAEASNECAEVQRVSSLRYGKFSSIAQFQVLNFSRLQIPPVLRQSAIRLFSSDFRRRSPSLGDWAPSMAGDLECYINEKRRGR
jgi:hypothetical protein